VVSVFKWDANETTLAKNKCDVNTEWMMPIRPLAERLTVVLLTYNCAHRIERTLDHLLALGIPVIAVDNASVDGTREVLARFPAITVIALSRNIGAAGRNAGAEAALTPYVAFCDDDGWYDPEGLALAVDLLDRHDELALINARILVGPEHELDPISAEMAASPIRRDDDLPGTVLYGFMAGAAIVRREAFLAVGGYDPRYFMGGEEQTVALPLAKAGWALRYVPAVVAHHAPSMENATRFRAHGLRNTIVNAWLHRPVRSAIRWTAFTLADLPKNRDWLRGVRMTVAAIPWIARERHPMARALDAEIRLLDARRFAERRPFFSARAWSPEPAAASGIPLTRP
jgi:GT2 family glycosyltransferase